MNERLIKQVAKMVKFDQKIRFNYPYKIIVLLTDYFHKLKIKALIKKNGYPNQELLGEDGMTNFWMLVKNMDLDIDLQKKCLENCKFNVSEYAHLYDRVQINSGLGQKFGTILNKPISNLKETNKNRVEIGWLTVQDWIEDFNSKDELGRKLDLKVNDDGSAEYIK